MTKASPCLWSVVRLSDWHRSWRCRRFYSSDAPPLASDLHKIYIVINMFDNSMSFIFFTLPVSPVAPSRGRAVIMWRGCRSVLTAWTVWTESLKTETEENNTREKEILVFNSMSLYGCCWSCILCVCCVTRCLPKSSVKESSCSVKQVRGFVTAQHG